MTKYRIREERTINGYRTFYVERKRGRFIWETIEEYDSVAKMYFAKRFGSFSEAMNCVKREKRLDEELENPSKIEVTYHEV